MLEKIGAATYKLKLPHWSTIHPLFYMSLLKKTLIGTAIPILTAPVYDNEGNLSVEPTIILARRVLPRNNRAITQVLMQWFNMALEDVTFEGFSFIKS